MLVACGVYEADDRFGIDEAPDEPCTRDAVHLHAGARDPYASALYAGRRDKLLRHVHAHLELPDCGFGPAAGFHLEIVDVDDVLQHPAQLLHTRRPAIPTRFL